MECKRSPLVIDAIPQDLPVKNKVNVCKNKIVKALLRNFTEDDYRSMFFLLMEYVGLDRFLSVTKQEKCHLEQEFWEIYYKNFNDCKILIELLGRMKMYKKLRMLGTCGHVYKNFQDRKFNEIDAIWKMLYSLCEELTDSDLEVLKKNVPSNFQDLIVCAEDWFCWALKNNLFSETDLSGLRNLFNNYPNCLKIIKDFEGKIKSYDIRTPNAAVYCGIALIINFDTFDAMANLEKREGSDIDVNLLKDLWQTFGFRTDIFTNLTCQETLEKLNHYAKLDHSNYDVFVCCILSHGKSNSIYSSDGVEIPISTLVASITNNSSSLAIKPKLFFIQACQGTNIQQGVGKPVYKLGINDDSVIKSYNLQVPPIASDVFMVTSSIDGFVSFRSVRNGSWFIRALYNSMMKYGDKYSIFNVMTEVNEEVGKLSADFGPGAPRNAQQIVNCSYTLKKTLILKKRCKN